MPGLLLPLLPGAGPISTVNDWYLYGSLISNVDLIHSFFQLVEINSFDPATLLRAPPLKLLEEFFSSLDPLDQMFVSPSSKFPTFSEGKRAEQQLNLLFSRLGKVFR